jgi:hypothetical protein
MLPTSPLVGNAYVVSDSNKVWVYTGSRSASTATVGYVDSGMTYLEPEFTVEVNGGQVLTLNTATVEVGNNVQLTIVRTESSVNNSWNNTVPNTSTLSLIDSNTPVALFLKAAPAELPDDSYLGGDPRLTDENNEPLTTENGQYITGYY